MPPEWVFLAPLFFAGLWLGVCVLVSSLAGWKRLAGPYRCEQSVEGTTWRFCSASLRCGDYNGCLTLNANAAGLRLAVLFLFRAGHPPLFFPWTDVSLRRGRSFLRGEYVAFTFACEPSVPVCVSPRLARKIEAAAGCVWPELSA